MNNGNGNVEIPENGHSHDHENDTNHAMSTSDQNENGITNTNTHTHTNTINSQEHEIGGEKNTLVSEKQQTSDPDSTSKSLDETTNDNNDNEHDDDDHDDARIDGEGGGGGEGQDEGQGAKELTLEEQIAILTKERDAAKQVSRELLERLAQSADEKESEERAILNEMQVSLQTQMTKRAEYEHQVKAMEKNIESYKAKLSEYSHMEDEIGRLQTNVSQIMASKLSLEQEVSSLRSWREEYEHNTAILSNRLNEAKKKEATKSTTASRLEADNTSLKEQVASLQSQLESSKKAKDKTESTMEKLKKKCIERIQLTEAALVEEQNLNEERKKKMKVFVETKAEELRSAKSTNDELRSDLNKTSEALNHVRTKLHHMTEMYDSTSNKNRELIREITRIKKNTEQLHNLGSNLELELHKSAQETEEHKQKRNTAKHELMTMLRKLEAEQCVSEKLRDSIKFTFTPKALSQQQLLCESLDDLERELLKLSRKLGKPLPARTTSGSHEAAEGQESATSGGNSENSSNGKKNVKANTRSEWDTTRLLSNLEHETQLVSKEIMALNSSVERLHMLLDDSGEKNCVSTLNELFSVMASNSGSSVPVTTVGSNVSVASGGSNTHHTKFTKVITEDEDDAFL
mmetsp:Transcript_14406/g.21826  ORF Transcript_14406/g.21826 Transcript_14406/m.21826 type:complete len:632 (+) Transcript_14406:215-2110(+)